MKFQKVFSFILLVSFSIYSLDCTTAKFINPNNAPPEIKAKKILVYTKDNQQHFFTEVRIINDTLFGVNGIVFPEDRNGPQVVSISVSNIEYIQHAVRDEDANVLANVVSVLAITGLVILLFFGPALLSGD